MTEINFITAEKNISKFSIESLYWYLQINYSILCNCCNRNIPDWDVSNAVQNHKHSRASLRNLKYIYHDITLSFTKEINKYKPKLCIVSLRSFIWYSQLNLIFKGMFCKTVILIRHSHFSQFFILSSAKTCLDSWTFQHFHKENMHRQNFQMIKCGKYYRYTGKQEKKYQCFWQIKKKTNNPQILNNLIMEIPRFHISTVINKWTNIR